MLLAESLVLATCALAAAIDYRRGVIPNTLTVGACGVALVVHVANAVGLGDLSYLGPALLHWAGGAMLTALVPLLLWRKGALGGGDVKLFAAIGAFLGPLRGLEASLFVFSVGALSGVLTLAQRGSLGRVLEQTASRFTHRLRRLLGARKDVADGGAADETWIRFGPAIFVGTCVALFVQARGR